MAGDWIPMRTELADDPAVIAIGASLGIEEDLVVGKLHRFWSWANKQTHDGNAPGVTKTWIDRYLSVTGFADALESVQWLTCAESGICVPNFERYNSQSAKRRILTARRVARHKVTQKALPKEEKRREEKKKTSPNGEVPPLPPALDSDRFRIAWAKWQKHRQEIKKALKPTQAQAQLEQMAAWGIDRAVAAIDFTVAKGWQGLREPEHPTSSRPLLNLSLPETEQ